MDSSAALSQIDGGQLANENPSVFEQIERGIKIAPHGVAAICMHQAPDHLSGLVPVDEKLEAEDSVQANCLTLTYSQIFASA